MRRQNLLVYITESTWKTISPFFIRKMLMPEECVLGHSFWSQVFLFQVIRDKQNTKPIVFGDLQFYEYVQVYRSLYNGTTENSLHICNERAKPNTGSWVKFSKLYTLVHNPFNLYMHKGYIYNGRVVRVYES